MLDEIEKAHPEVFNILLQVFDEGHLRDAKGRLANFKNTIIIMTSNIGSEEIERSKIGFGEKREISLKEKIEERLKDYFRPEFLNRIDEIIIFKPLGQKEMEKILEIQFEKIKKRLEEKRIFISLTDKAKKYLAKKGYDPNFGARPLKRAIQKYIQDPLSLALLKGEFMEGDRILADWKTEERLEFTKMEERAD